MLKRHEKSESHQACLARANRCIEICEGDAQSVEEFISTANANRIKKNRESILSIIDVMLALGKRGLALIGTWDKDTRVEDGNFNFFIK